MGKTCGEFGGQTRKGSACQLAAGWGTDHPDTGRCRQHETEASAQEAAAAHKKANEAEQPQKAQVRGCLAKGIGGPMAVVGGIMLLMVALGARQQKMEIETAVIVGGIGLLLSGVGGKLLLRGKQLTAPTAEDIMAKDPRAPVVYLRSFEGDKDAGKLQGGGYKIGTLSEEEQLADLMNEIGPFVAIGKPGEKHASVGAARMYVPDSNWRQKVNELLSRARLVVFRAGNTDGFWWEVQQSVRNIRPEKLVFLIPENDAIAGLFWERFEEYFRVPVPATTKGKVLVGTLQGVVYFDPDWTPHFAGFQKRVFRSSLTQPVYPKLKFAMRPVFERCGIRWHAPGVSPVRVYLIFMLSMMVLGLLFLAFLIATGEIDFQD